MVGLQMGQREGADGLIRRKLVVEFPYPLIFKIDPGVNGAAFSPGPPRKSGDSRLTPQEVRLRLAAYPLSRHLRARLLRERMDPDASFAYGRGQMLRLLLLLLLPGLLHAHQIAEMAMDLEPGPDEVRATIQADAAYMLPEFRGD